MGASCTILNRKIVRVHENRNFLKGFKHKNLGV